MPPKTYRLLNRYARFKKQTPDELLEEIGYLLLAHERFGGLVEVLGVALAYIEAFRHPRRPQFLSGPLTEEVRRQLIIGFLKIRPGKQMNEKTAAAALAPDELTEKDLDSIKAYVKAYRHRRRPRIETRGSRKRVQRS
ncbi:MAG TPA: hypothetical protein VH601_19290 [Bryobacteraceae bacterium]